MVTDDEVFVSAVQAVEVLRAWEEWGLDRNDALEAGLGATPQATWLRNRTNSGDCAVNASAVVMVVGLTRLALEGRILAKFNPQNTAEKMLAFFNDELGCDFSSTLLCSTSTR